ncbi:unnamed protein product, partial [Mesorhabditis belari]|uniref:Uncharacterized protein n=1 Tax=Mesorhabditis belari TaxID=2138241 RepID=A0AAF3J3P6_9BILA
MPALPEGNIKQCDRHARERAYRILERVAGNGAAIQTPQAVQASMLDLPEKVRITSRSLWKQFGVAVNGLVDVQSFTFVFKQTPSIMPAINVSNTKRMKNIQLVSWERANFRLFAVWLEIDHPIVVLIRVALMK